MTEGELGPRGLPCSSLGEEVGDEGLQRGKVDIFDLSGIDGKDVILGLGELGQFGTDSFVDAAADAVAGNGGLVDFFGHHHGKAPPTAGVVVEGERNLGVADRPAVFVGVANATTRVKTVFFGKHIEYYTICRWCKKAPRKDPAVNRGINITGQLPW